MSKLATLRTRLNSLRQRRALLRWGNAWSALVAGVLWVLVAAFIVDYSLEMSRPQRFVALVFVAAASWWVFKRLTRPFLGQRETELDMALLVEKQQEIDTDLVAALQFESPAAKHWGSESLERAVIDYVADFGHTLDVFKNFDTRQLRRRLAICGATVALVLIAVGLYPHHAEAFLNRLLLGSQHYPTRTVIEQILVNGQTVKVHGNLASLKVPFGKPLRLEVTCSGELPAKGSVQLTTVGQGVHTEVSLVTHGTVDSGRQQFVGEQPRLVDSVNYQIFLGDAWTDPVQLRVIPLPVVSLDLQASPPEYAAKIERTQADKSGSRQIAVIEGSQVKLQVVSSNKPLESATVTIDKRAIPLLAIDDEHKVWRLPDKSTPFSRVMQPLKYHIQVKDLDGLGLEQPISGSIRLKLDRPPRILAGVISKKVLPGAKPKISIGATDDYGLAKIRIIQEVIHENGETHHSTVDVEAIPVAQQPQTAYRSRYSADLKSLKLTKGDQLKLTLEAIDYRGDVTGQSAVSEPLVLEVTDVQGFLAGMVETDEQSARRLDAIIQRQLGIGETK